MSLLSELGARLDAADADHKLTNEQMMKISTEFYEEKTIAKINELKQTLETLSKSTHGGASTDEDRFQFLFGIVAGILVAAQMREEERK